MATLLFSAVGTLIGGPLGGAIGALAGRAVDSAIIGGGAREGPRLRELAPTVSTYGEPLPRHFGRMRVPGSIIWATDLVEHAERQGGGKGRPSVTTYSYTASFAVALASRPIAGLGRIWADGNLLRGEAGDLKVGGALRLHHGWGDQPVDPLIAAAEGAARCPAWRGLAYVVFEDLHLGDFFNRIPALSFEVIADSGAFSLQDVVGAAIADADAAVPLPGIAGLSCAGPLADTLRMLDPVLPMDCDAGGGRLTIARARLQAAPVALAEPAVAVADGDFGGRNGFSRRREPQPSAAPEIVRYYDVDRDYQPGLQRATGRSGPGQPRAIELPAALAAADARALAESAARRALRRRETVAWRSAALDPAVAPGAVVTLPGIAGRWRVAEWEWREHGVELMLHRAAPAGADALPAGTADPGRIVPVADLAAPETVLAAFELPWDGSGSGDVPCVFAAASAAAANWRGAALYVDQGDGALLPLGPSGRARAIVGLAETALAPASPLPAALTVRQRGSHALSEPLFLMTLD
ncbi:MAG: phage tail protein [Novosphingobium sp.]